MWFNRTSESSLWTSAVSTSPISGLVEGVPSSSAAETIGERIAHRHSRHTVSAPASIAINVPRMVIKVCLSGEISESTCGSLGASCASSRSMRSEHLLLSAKFDRQYEGKADSGRKHTEAQWIVVKEVGARAWAEAIPILTCPLRRSMALLDGPAEVASGSRRAKDGTYGSRSSVRDAQG